MTPRHPSRPAPPERAVQKACSPAALHPRRTQGGGYTLIEIMIVVAILAILSAIAIPLYSGYVRESKLGAARANIEPLRTAIEDYWLDNGSYLAINGHAWIPLGSTTLETAEPGWKPEGDDEKFSYRVTASASSYTITVTYLDLPDLPVTYHKD